MMIPRSRYKQRWGLNARVVLATAVVLLVAVLIGPWLRDVVVSLMSRAADVTQYALVPRAVLISRLEAAETELARTRYQGVLYESVAEKARHLETELGLRPVMSYSAARVVGQPPRTQYDTLLIDKGSDEGVVLGDVASVEGIAVGTVTSVSPSSAVVELYSSPGAEHDAELGDQKAIVVVVGRGGGALDSLVPGALDIRVGDAVRDVRTGYIFGTVVSVVHREIDTEQLLHLALPVDLTRLRVVSLTHP